MILLEKSNSAVRDFLWGWMDGKKKGREQMIDFNDVYMLQEDENALAISLQLVSLVMPASDSWKATLQEKLSRLGPGLTIRSEGPLTSNFTLTVLVDASVYMPRHKFNSNQKAKGVTNKEAIREDYEKYRGETQSRNESVFNALSGLKRIVLGSVFERHFEAATAEDAETDWERLSAYKNEAVYVRSRQQSVRVIYQIQFSCREEEIFGKIFAQEFNEAKRKLAGLPIPPVTWSDQEPGELSSGLLVAPTSGRDVHYFHFTLARQHIVSGSGRDRAIDQLLMFRNYLDYHIKCSKAYMHSRMRFKTAYFLQILNRADDTANNKKPSIVKQYDIKR